MSVLVDGRPLQTPSVFRGIGRYVGHITRAFGQDERCPFLFFQGDDTPPGVSGKVFTAAPRHMITLSDSFFLPPLFRRQAVSAYHSTAFGLPRRVRNVRYLLTVFDLTVLKFPRRFSWRQRLVSRRIIESARRADIVLPISARTAADLSEFISIEPARIRVIRPMLDDGLAPRHAEKPAMSPPSEYLLYVGGADRTKNIETLLKAVSRLRMPLSSLLKLQDRRLVAFLGHVPDRHLAWLYQNAAAFIFPSLNEGFGYPPLEALQCGTPAIVSRAGALPETLENAVLYVDNPLDADEWCGKIRSLLESPGLRRELLARATDLLPRYSPEAFRENLERAYFSAG
jgi:glycosyltransferase involved in cell wall biosynthesis